jgi:hypothetical protein
MPQAIFSSSIVLKLRDDLSSPILSPLLENRLIGLIILGVVVLHSGLVMLGLPGWQCPVRDVLGVPCPGCGLSRAMTALIQGDWQTSLIFHAFAPFFLIALALFACVLLLPQPQSNWLIRQVEFVERRTGVVAILLVGLVFYWLTRLFFFGEAFINLILG